MKKYKVAALIGPAGSGKDTVLKRVVMQNKDFHRIISHTTRPKREGEIENIDYFYVSPDELANRLVKNEMAEIASFRDWFYGTAYDNYYEDKINIGVFAPDRVEILLHDPQMDVTVFFIDADDKIRLLRQLNRETHPDVDEIVRRFLADQKDFDNAHLTIPYERLQNNQPIDLAEVAKFIQDYFL